MYVVQTLAPESSPHLVISDELGESITLCELLLDVEMDVELVKSAVRTANYFDVVQRKCTLQRLCFIGGCSSQLDCMTKGLDLSPSSIPATSCTSSVSRLALSSLCYPPIASLLIPLFSHRAARVCSSNC